MNANKDGISHLDSTCADDTNEPLIVTSNQGDFQVDPNDGLVLVFQPSREYQAEPLDFERIYRFDLQEWFQYWEKAQLVSHIDILDLSFWYVDEAGDLQYEEAEEDFRGELRYQWMMDLISRA